MSETNNQQSFNEFFDLIKKLKEEFSKKEEFNPLKIIKTNENSHSDFIAELLKPDGKHNYSDFLNLFLEKFELPKFLSKKISIVREHQIATNHRIDIAIFDTELKEQIIIIENKITEYGDQENQLLNYFRNASNQYNPNNIHIIYLTKHSKNFTESSFPKIEKSKLKNEIRLKSFEKEIIEWLESCLNHVENKNNRLYCCIEMYIELIRKTINRDKYMEEIIKTLVEKPEQMKLAIDVLKALQGRNFLEFGSISRDIIIRNINESFNILGIENNNYAQQDDGMYYFDEINETENFDIAVERDCIYGELNDKKLIKLEIKGYDLNDKYLVALLTNEQEVIQQWINDTIKQLIG